MKKSSCSVIALLLSCLLLFTGCKDSIIKLTEKIKETKKAETIASVGLRPVPVGSGLKVVPSDRYPAGFNTKYPLEQGSWSTEKPLFDPMGSEDQYSYVSYDYSEGEIIYVNESYRRTKHRAGGEHWILELTDDASDAMLHIEKYIIDLGGQILSPPADEIVFTLEESSFVWWGKITQSETTISIELFKERLLKVDETITIDTAGLADQPTFFTTRHGGNRLQSLTVSITGAEHGDEVEMYAQGGYNSGGYIRDVVYDNRLIAGYNESGVYILDDIPQEPGDTKWYIKVYNEAITVSITLNEIADLTPVKHGENMGAVLVKGIPYGSVTVPVKSVSNHTEFSIYHPDLLEDIEEVYGNQTSDGDTIFWLPTGYWNLNIFSDILNTTSYARLIPVSEGELTVVDMASNLNSILSQTADIKEGTDEHGMTFLDVPKEQGDQVSLSFLLFDSLNKNPVLQKEDIKIQENGELVELISVEKLDIPPSVVLLLDSSGSMGDQMQPAIDAAKAFVQGLPDNSTIQVIDFDSTARQLAGSTKAEVISSLDGVTKGGSTALYDATIMGLDLLKAEQRPTLVIFTDGKNEPAAGGLNDKSIVMEAIRATKVPTYTIGFGKEHAPSAQPPKDEQDELADETDEGTVKEGSDLIDFATVSEGKYYSALDQNALNNVFAAIAARLGNSYTAVYKRPLQANISDVPVVTVVLDRSGSMNELIENQGEKMQIAKDMFRDFFMEIPDGIMTQFITFEDIWLDQVLTKDKAPILYALSDLEASGGTNILDSAQLGYDTLRGVPSSKRILVFLTDAAMEGSNNEVFAELLTKIKEADIKSLWLGLGMEEEGDEENFAWASQTAGGSYLLPNSAKELSEGLDKMLHEVNQQGSTDKTIITMNIKLPNEKGKLQSYSGSTEHKLSPLKSSDKAMEAPQAIKITMEKLSVEYFTDMSNAGNVAGNLESEGFDQYGSEVSQLLYGGDSPSTDTRIISRIPLKAKDNNEGIEISASEYYRINRLRGIDAPQGMEYIALNLQIKNLFTDREFQIPDITSHFYLSVNDAGSYPASIMSWLAETPLVNPGENQIRISPGEMKKGVLIFIVPREPIEDLQLNFYDEVHNHIQMLLTGSPRNSDLQLEKLSTTGAENLSDSFTLTVTAYNDVEKIQQYNAPKDTVYRIVEGEITSKVQALLDIIPAEIFFMNISTAQGNIRIPISPVTSFIPYGYLQPKLLAPGSSNTIRWVFAVPKELADAKAEIFGDIVNGAIYIPIKSGSSNPSSGTLGTFKGDWIDLTINELSFLSEDVVNALQQGMWVEEPVEEEPSEEEPVDEEPVDEEPVDEEPVDEEPVDEEPVNEEPVEEDPVEEDPVEEEPVDEEPTDEEPIGEEPIDEEPIDGEPNGLVYVVADITITDKKDGYGTSDIYNAFRFVSNRVKEGSRPGIVLVDDSDELALEDLDANEFLLGIDELTEKLVMGIDQNWNVMDGESRRGLIIFSLPNSEFTLQSQFFEGLNLAPQNTNFTSEKLLVVNSDVDEEDQSFADLAAEEIRKIIMKYESENVTNSVDKTGKPEAFSLDQSDGKNYVPVPSFNGIGIERLESPKTLDEVLELLRGLAWRPSYAYTESNWAVSLSAQAVLTQGWGNEFDLAMLAEQLFSRIGLRPEKTVTKLTNQGKKFLIDYLRIKDPEKLDMTTLPAIAYCDENGEHKLLVVPFMQDISELGGTVYMMSNELEPIEINRKTANIAVTVEAIPKDEATSGSGVLNSNGLFGAFSDNLAPEEVEEDEKNVDSDTIDIQMFDEEITLEDLSNDAIDIGFGVAEGKAYTAYMEAPGGRIFSQKSFLKENYQPVNVKFTLTIEEEEYVHEAALKEGETIDSVFTSISINMPDLPVDAWKRLGDDFQEGHKNADKPNELSALRWYTRNNLYRFIGSQTAFEDQLATDLELTIGRTTKPRIIAATTRAHDNANKIEASIDLMSSINQVHNGSEEAITGFHIMSGLTASRMEGLALGEQGCDFSTIWDKAPEDMQFFFIDSTTRSENIDVLREGGMPDKLLRSIESSSEDDSKFKMFMIPDMPSNIDGQERWAWLEIDTNTYETIAVLDTGERGGMAEYLILNGLKEPDGGSYAQFGMGVLAGVDVGLWSMCSAVLVTENYTEAIELAAIYAANSSVAVHAFFGFMDGIKSSADLLGGNKYLKAKGGKFNVNKGRTEGKQIMKLDANGNPISTFEFGKEYLTLEFEVEVPGFVKGFDSGLEYYFDAY